MPESGGKSSKFPRLTFKAIMGRDAEPRSELEKCKDGLKHDISLFEQEYDTSIDFAILADVRKQNKGIILVCRLRAQEFYELDLDQLETVSCRDVRYHTLGALDCGEVRLSCSDKTFTSFFTSTVDLQYRAHVCYCDLGQEHENLEMENAKAEKKQAKKHRRQVTASTVTSPSEASLTSFHMGDGEDAKLRQREKNKAKKKAQKERRKAKATEEETQKTLLIASSTGKEDREAAVEDDQCVKLLGSSRTNHIVVHNKRGNQLISKISKLGLEVLQLRLSDGLRLVVDEEGLGDDDSSSTSIASSGTEEGDALKVIQFTTREDIDRNIMKAKGPVMVATRDGDEPDKQDEKAWGELKYLGRGLWSET